MVVRRQKKSVQQHATVLETSTVLAILTFLVGVAAIVFAV
jgi:hypothetical protein